MKLAASLVAIAMAMASPAFAEPTQVFPLTGADLPSERRGMTARLTRAIADAIDAEVSSVSIEDAAGLLDCDVESTSCLESVSKSVGNKQLVFGTVAPGKGAVLKVTLTRFRPGPDRQQQTFEITGLDEAYPDELVRKAAPLFGKTGGDDPPPDEPPADGPADAPPVDAPPSGSITPGTYGLIAGGLVGVGAGIGFRISASGLADDVEAFPEPMTAADFDELTDLESRGRMHTTLGVVLIGAGGVALTAGIVRAILQKRSPAPVDERVVSLVPIRGGAAITVTWGIE